LISEVSQTLTINAFVHAWHAALYQLLCDIDREGGALQAAEIVAAAERREVEIGGGDYLQWLSTSPLSQEGGRDVVERLAYRAALRRIADSAQALEAEINDGQRSDQDIRRVAESLLYDLLPATGGQCWQAVSETIDEAFTEIQSQAQCGEMLGGIPTGLTDLDARLGGLQPSSLVVVAARPAMGKTALALNIAVAAARSGVGVGVLAQQQSVSWLAKRLLCTESQLELARLRLGALDRETEWPRLVRAAESLYSLPIHVIGHASSALGTVLAQARRLRRRMDELGLLIIDDVGLIRGDSRLPPREQDQQISCALRELAVELGICVLCVSQLSRDVEYRLNKVPFLHDLKGYGALEEMADVVLLIHREDYYHKDRSTRPGQADIIIAKHCCGTQERVTVRFSGELLQFADLSTDEEPLQR